MNYLYLKVSDAPVKVGDLTTEGIIKERTNAGDFIVQINNNETDVFGGYYLQALTPLLIMDAPEIINPPEILTMKRYSVLTNGEGYRKSLDAIPFYSNEQVYKYLQSKGIKPEPEMLIEFNGEVELQNKCRSHHCSDQDNKTGCNLCEKVALIKQPSAESKEELHAPTHAMEFALWMMDNHYFNSVTNSKGIFFYKGFQSPEKRQLLTIEKVYEHFKIERRAI